MLSKKLAAFAAAASVIVGTSPALAQANAASSLSPVAYANGTRAGASMDDANELGGGSGGLWAGAIGLALVAALILVVLDETDDEDEFDGPVSP